MSRFNRSFYVSCGAMILTGLQGSSGPSLAGLRSASPPGQAQGSHRKGDHRRDRCQPLRDFPRHARAHDQRCPPPGGSAGVAKGDFNGDGIGDLAVGVPDEDLPGCVFSDVFPISVDCVAAGEVVILYGTLNDGLSTSPGSSLIHQGLGSVLDDVESNDRFGEALAAGDFNGDTFSDLAVVVPGDNAIQIFQGGADGLELSGNRLLSAFPDIVADPSFAIRPGLVWGDFNGDGFGDLAIEGERVGLTTEDLEIRGFDRFAAVVVLYGSQQFGLQLVGRDTFSFSNAELGAKSVSTTDATEMTLSAGDFSNDEADDLVVGLPLADVLLTTGQTVIDGGRVTILPGVVGTVVTGGVTNLGSTGLTEINANSAPRIGERFGTALAAGDFDGDGADDLAVGAPREDVANSSGGFATDGGFVAVFSHGTTLHASYTQLPLLQDPRNFEMFGGALTTGDFDGNGAKDLVIGAPGDTINGVAGAGSVNVIYGIFGVGLPRPPAIGLPAINGTVQFIHQDSAVIGDIAELDDHFGATLTAWNFGKTAHTDLAVGVPDEGILIPSPLNPIFPPRVFGDAGLVHVIYRSTKGLSTLGSQSWHQNTLGVPDSVETGDRFGAAIY